MSKFWGGMALLIVTGIVLLLTYSTIAQPDITVYDLETECIKDKGESSEIMQNQDNTFTIRGQYPVGSPGSRIDYDYTIEGNEVVLDIVNTRDVEPENYSSSCDGLAVYHLQTGEFEEGRYEITLKHDGEVKKRNVYGIN